MDRGYPTADSPYRPRDEPQSDVVIEWKHGHEGDDIEEQAVIDLGSNGDEGSKDLRSSPRDRRDDQAKDSSRTLREDLPVGPVEEPEDLKALLEPKLEFKNNSDFSLKSDTPQNKYQGNFDADFIPEKSAGIASIKEPSSAFAEKGSLGNSLGSLEQTNSPDKFNTQEGKTITIDLQKANDKPKTKDAASTAPKQADGISISANNIQAKPTLAQTSAAHEGPKQATTIRPPLLSNPSTSSDNIPAPTWGDLIESPLDMTPLNPPSTQAQPITETFTAQKPAQPTDLNPAASSALIPSVPSSRRSHESQADIIGTEILAMLLDELMMDGLVLRELFKLQVDLPKGIKTNIKAVKKYLARLCEFIGSKQRSNPRTLRQGCAQSAQLSPRTDAPGETQAVPL